MRRTTSSLLLLVPLVAGLGACGDDDTDSSTPMTEDAAVDGGAGGGEQVVVDMADFAFAPGEVEVTVGQEVVWTNSDAFAHTAEADDGTFDTGNVDAEATSEPVTFDEAGTYAYFCAIHNSMTGTVTVTA